MTTSKSMSISPRCAYDQFQEYREDAWAQYRGGFLHGFATMAAFSVAIVAALAGMFG